MNEWTQTLRDPFDQVVAEAGRHLPNVLAALAFVVVGLAVAWMVRTWTARLLGRFPWLRGRQAVDAELSRVGIRKPPSEIVASVLFWIVLLFFLTAATDALGMPVLATWLAGISEYLPRLLMAALLLLAGVLGGNLAREAVRTALVASGTSWGELLGRVAQVVIVAVAVITAVDQLGVESRFLTATVTIVIGAAIGGTAIAFGLGARAEVANIIAAHYVRQFYRIGHTVRVGEIEGKILAFTPTAVIVESPAGQARIPSATFSSAVSVLVAAAD